MLAALAVRDFRYLWFSTASDQLAMWVQIVAQGWLAYQLGGSATFLGVVSAASAVPNIALMLPGGVIADRLDRRATLVYANLLRTLASFALAFAVWTEAIQPWQLVLLVVVISGGTALNLPARQSLGPELVGPRLVSNAVALYAVSFNTSRVLGPAIAGGLIVVVGLTGCFVVATALLGLATLFTLLIGPDAKRDPVGPHRSVAENLLDGLRYVRDEPIVRGTIIVAALQNLFGMTWAQIMPVFADDVFEVGAGGLGALMTAAGIGATLGAAVSALARMGHQRGAIMFGTALGFALSTIAFAMVPWYGAALLALAVLGATSALSAVVTQTILNVALPDTFRGRVMSIYMLTWNFPLIAALPAGWATDQIGAPTTVALSGALLLIAMVGTATTMAGLRRFRDDDYVEGYRVARPL